MNFKRRKLQMKRSLILEMEELKEVLGAGAKIIEPQSHDRCTGCDAICAITCAMYMHE